MPVKSKSAKKEGAVPSKVTASGSDAKDDFDAREYILRMNPYYEKVGKKLLAGERVFFYPACGLNWQPVRDYSSQCDLFVYCDWNITKHEFAQGISELKSPTLEVDDSFGYEPAGPLVEQIGAMNHLPWLLAQPVHNTIEPWVELIWLKLLGPEEQKREIGLLYLAANPIEAYRVMFTQKQTAPKFIFLKKPSGVPTKAWHFLAGADGPVAQVVASNTHRPENLIIDESPKPIGLWLGQR